MRWYINHTQLVRSLVIVQPRFWHHGVAPTLVWVFLKVWVPSWCPVPSNLARSVEMVYMISFSNSSLRALLVLTNVVVADHEYQISRCSSWSYWSTCGILWLWSFSLVLLFHPPMNLMNWSGVFLAQFEAEYICEALQPNWSKLQVLVFTMVPEVYHLRLLCPMIDSIAKKELGIILAIVLILAICVKMLLTEGWNY